MPTRALGQPGDLPHFRVHCPCVCDLHEIKLCLIPIVSTVSPQNLAASAYITLANHSCPQLRRTVPQGRNFARFKRNFRGTDWVKVPSVEWALSSPQVLTLEYLPGTKITDLQGLREMRHDRTLIAERATEAYLTQILCDFFPLA